MDAKRITQDLSVSGQLAPSEVGAIVEAGFRSIICNRPDGEAADQPAYEEVATQARKAGLEVWDVKKIAVDEGMIERGEIGERGWKWVGRKIWYGMKFRKPL